MKVLRFGILLFTLGVSCVLSSAQYVRPTTGGTMREFNFNNPMSALAATMVMNKAREDALAKRLGADNSNTRGTNSTGGTGTTSASSVAAYPARQIDETQFRFQPNPASSKVRKLADDLGSTQAERDQYFTLMNAIIDGFEKLAAQAGKPHDVALALSYFLGENARIYHGNPAPPDSQFLDLRNMIAQVLGAGGAIKNATNQQKQEMYETLVAYTGITQFGYEQSLKAGNREMAQGYQRVAGQSLQTVTKMSPDAINFTGDGLTISVNSAATTQTINQGES